MADNKLIWIAIKCPKEIQKISGGYWEYITQIINIKTYDTLYTFYISEKSFNIFKKIMESDSYSVQYAQNINDNLREAAKIKLKISPHKPIPYINDPKIWQKTNTFYLGS